MLYISNKEVITPSSLDTPFYHLSPVGKQMNKAGRCEMEDGAHGPVSKGMHVNVEVLLLAR